MPRRISVFLFVCMVLVGCALVAAWLQSRTNRVLRAEVAAAQVRASDRQRAEADLKRLVASLPPPAEIDALRADRAALEGLRKQTKPESESGSATPANAPRPSRAVTAHESLASGQRVPATDCANVGRASALESFQSFVWAATSGEVATLAQGLAVEPAAEPELLALWPRLPPAEQARYQTPLQFLAALTLRDVPIGTVQVSAPPPGRASGVGYPGAPTNLLVATVSGTGPEAPRKMVVLSFSEVREGDWKLMVPRAVVQRYATTLP